MFLFSDGISSVGVTERTQLMAILTAMLQKTGSPNIFTFGFGGVYDYRIMNGISEEGKGHCMHIQDVEVIPAAFATALGSLMSVASQNFELTLAPEVSHLAEGCNIAGLLWQMSRRCSVAPQPVTASALINWCHANGVVNMHSH